MRCSEGHQSSIEQPARPASRASLDRLGHALRVLGEAVLEVGRHGQLGGRRQRRGVHESLVAADAVVQSPERGRVPAAGGGQCLEAERGEQARGAGVPRIGHQQGALAMVQREELGGLLGGVGHGAPFAWLAWLQG